MNNLDKWIGILITMVNSPSSAWGMSLERFNAVANLRKHYNGLYCEELDLMIAEGHDPSMPTSWAITAERVKKLLHILRDRDRSRILNHALDLIRQGSREDQVDHRPWVTQSIELLEFINKSKGAVT